MNNYMTDFGEDEEVKEIESPQKKNFGVASTYGANFFQESNELNFDNYESPIANKSMNPITDKSSENKRASRRNRKNK